MRFVFFFLFFTSFSWAQLETERSVSVQANVRTQEEAKPFLLHSAVLGSIEQYSTALKIDFKMFLAKLEERFASYFEDYKQRKLLENFGKGYRTQLGEDQKKTFLAGLESRRSLEFIQFANLSHLVDSYAFTEISPVKEDSTQWKAKVVFSLNQGKLQKYTERLLSGTESAFRKLYLVSEINLLNFTWKELGLSDSTDFTQPLMSSWSKWLVTNQPENVSALISCEDQCHGDYLKWLQVKQEEGMQVPEASRDALWLKVSFNVRKEKFLKDLNEWQFEWDTSVILLDSNTKKVLSSYNLGTQTRIWRRLDQNALNSAFVSALYGTPMDVFSKIKGQIESSNKLSGLSHLVIVGHNHLGDVLSLMNTLRESGRKGHFEFQLDSFSQKEAQLLCFYQGEEKSFTDLLSGVKELKSSHSYKVVNEFTGVHHVLRLVAE